MLMKTEHVMKVQWYQPAAVSSSARRGHQMLIWRGMWSSHCSPGHMSVSETRVATSQSSSSSVCLTRAECTPLANRTRQNRWSPIQLMPLLLPSPSQPVLPVPLPSLQPLSLGLGLDLDLEMDDEVALPILQHGHSQGASAAPLSTHITSNCTYWW
ncbi:uncharacterized protein LOC126278554 isoform X1 [Schistocerca gregaria]|uniref:uncharacterized protein LOC126278554 isoform X1 n=1 Tax=Schistocerca gregaria TaxID=7010 RepID=UPI00211EA774|nr:uncharacterized protein LOC126278554 isoform X1 [Schistocerca gregaria]